MSGQGEMVSFLAGYRVLDLTDQQGDYCARVLGDFGADVIKVEPPGGDPSRGTGPFFGDRADPEHSLSWFFANANKRGITLNLASADGRALLRRLVKTADFVVESFKPGYLADLGLDYAGLAAIKPDLVMTSVTPFGQSGPYAGFAGADIVLVAMGGLMRMFGDLDRAPVRMSAPQAHYLGGLHGAMGSMLAHFHREVTGEGQHVDVSTQEGVALSLLFAAEIWDLLKVNYRGTGPFLLSPRAAPNPPLFLRQMYECADGHVVMYFFGGANAGYVASSKKIVEWANAEGQAMLLKDMDWAWGTGDVENAQALVDALFEQIIPFIRSKTKAELFAHALEDSLLIAPVTTVEDIAVSPQLGAREFFVPVEHAELGATLTYPGAPVKMSGARWAIRRPAPRIGEHNEEIYAGELGLAKEDLAVLKAAGAI